MSSSRMRGRGRVAGTLVLALVAVLLTPTPAEAASGTTTRASVASDGTQPNGSSRSADISADGRYVAFQSLATNLVPNDTDGADDIFVRDNQTATTTRVSVSSTGAQGTGQGEWRSREPVISADGRYVAFTSMAANLVPGDTNGVDDIFVHDRQTATTTRVSVSGDGTQANGGSRHAAISADGSIVAFASHATNLVTGDTNFAEDIFVRDLAAGTTTRVNVASSVPPAPGAQAAHAPGAPPFSGSPLPSISADGRYVSFLSNAVNLVPGDTKFLNDVFVHDRTTATTTRVSVASDGTEANSSSLHADISADGTTVAFTSFASNLVAGDTNLVADVFVHDRATATTTRASVAGDGSEAKGDSAWPRIDADGSTVSFSSYAANLVPGDTNGFTDAFVRDRQAGTTTMVSAASDGTQGNVGSVSFVPITDDGRFVAFESDSSNLVPDDTNNRRDIFVRDRQPPAVVSVGDVIVHEGDAGIRPAVFTVSLTEPAPAAVTVAYATSEGSALGIDFTAKSGTVSFAAGATSATVKVPVIGDTADEGAETFNLVLSSPAGAVISDDTGVGTILDDDSATVTGRRLAIGDVSVNEGDAGGRAAVFTVSLSKASTSYVWVNYATAKGTAIGTDFTAQSGSLRLAPGITGLTVRVPITADTLVEDTETFTVKLSGASGAIITDASGVGTIIDDD